MEASDADAARQLFFDGSLHQFGREERQRDRQIDLSSATFVACSNLLCTGDDAGNDLIKRSLTTRGGCDTSVAREIGRRSSGDPEYGTIISRRRSWASASMRRLALLVGVSVWGAGHADIRGV